MTAPLLELMYQKCHHDTKIIFFLTDPLDLFFAKGQKFLKYVLHSEDWVERLSSSRTAEWAPPIVLSFALPPPSTSTIPHLRLQLYTTFDFNSRLRLYPLSPHPQRSYAPPIPKSCYSTKIVIQAHSSELRKILRQTEVFDHRNTKQFR